MVYTGNLEKSAVANRDYRRVVATTRQMQLVLMSLAPGEEIGLERHAETTQFIRVEEGTAVVTIGRGRGARRSRLRAGGAVLVPGGTWHNVACPRRAAGPTKLSTLYSPPEHPPRTRQKKKGTRG